MNIFNFSSPEKLVVLSTALLAFWVAFLTLIARDRKLPYTINRSIWIFSIYFVNIFIAGTAQIVSKDYVPYFSFASYACLFLSIIITFAYVMKIAVALKSYSYSIRFKDMKIYRKFKLLIRNLKSRPDYEHNPRAIPEDLFKMVFEILSSDPEEQKKWLAKINESPVSSIAFIDNMSKETDKYVIKLAHAFLQKDFIVHYLTVSRPPYGFIYALKQFCDSNSINWDDVYQRVIVADCYTPHFGFSDSVYDIKSRQLERETKVILVKGKLSFAGIHSCAADAFNLIKKRYTNKDARVPALIIYDGCYSLSDLESIDQYRVFLRHVMPSEKEWGGMLTILVESAVDEQTKRIIEYYSSITFGRNEVKSD